MKFSKKTIFFLILASLIICLVCGFWIYQKNRNFYAIIWTNQPEFAMYTEIFNASQNKYKAIIEYKENPAFEVYNTKASPDLVIGPWLKTDKTNKKFAVLNYIMSQQKINPHQFYTSLLNYGAIRKQQYFLPVSFNIPAIVFVQDNQQLFEPEITISLHQIRSLAKDFNCETHGVYSKMGFSPRWDPNFLYLVTRLYKTNYAIGGSLFTYNEKALKLAVDFIQDWTLESNTSTIAEDDFKFKYLYDPPHKLITNGRCLFSFMQSNELFSLSNDKQQSLEFKWIEHEQTIPIKENAHYIGLCKSSRHKKPAQAFLKWFFSEKTQAQLLERSQSIRSLEHSFGIAGGFSSIKAVNEKTFPLFYPHLLGQQPPQDMLELFEPLSYNWPTYKDQIIMPWIVETVSLSKEATEEVKPISTRISEWKKAH